jgi:serine/threonine-protein kinase
MDNRNATNRDLLVGLLALQNGLVDQDVLLLAFRTWTRDKSRRIADILAAQGVIDAGERNLLEGLAVKHFNRHDNDPEKSLAALNPGHSIRVSLANIGDPEIEATLGHAASGSGGTENDADRTGAYVAGTTASDSRRFRVLRPHAQGGLGAVFVALDAELNREVALKQILDRHADDPVSRTRFVLEAEITGGLEHPGVVPVYGLGTYGDGRPYYAMRFVRGDSLKETIAAFHADDSFKNDPGRRSLALRKLLRRFVDVCNAIDYAHTRGVLHRDIKPANVIVGKHGETLVVDWGLAKALGKAETRAAPDERTLMPSSTSGSAETLPGSAMGTPAYMSPEQAAGDLDRLGPQSDIYSLGATLYCLLTGEPAFDGDDVGAVLQAVSKGDFPPPRQINPAIDRALEAVCLKAMALKPDDRYATSRALSDDVERWAADEPVTAWHEPFGRRARRWARRNRTAVTAAAAALLMAMVGLTAVLAVQTRANAALTVANAHLELSNRREVKANADLKAANERERARFALAQDAIRTFYTGVSEDLHLKQKEFNTLRTKLLRGARESYQRLEGLLERQKDRESRLALGRAYRDVGELTSMIGTREEALAVHQRALGLFEEVPREAPNDPEPRYEVGRSLVFVGSMLSGTARTAQCLAALDRARTTLRSLVEAGLTDEKIQCELADAEHYLGAIVGGTYRSHEQLGAYERARTIHESLVSANPSIERFRLELASVCDSLGLSLRDAGRNREASAAFDRARELCEALVAANRTDPKFTHELARTLGNWTTSVPDDGSNDLVSQTLDRVRKLLGAVSKANPTSLILQADLAWIDTLIENCLKSAGRHAEAMEAYERALAARERLSTANPTSTRHIGQRIGLQRMIAWLHEQAGRRTDARASYERGRVIGEKAAQTLGADPGILEEMAYCGPTADH